MDVWQLDGADRMAETGDDLVAGGEEAGQTGNGETGIDGELGAAE
jgi:hypothetical protein